MHELFSSPQSAHASRACGERLCSYVGLFRDREDRSWAVQLKQTNKFCTLHIILSYPIRSAIIDIEEEKADGLFKDINNFCTMYIILPHPIPTHSKWRADEVTEMGKHIY